MTETKGKKMNTCFEFDFELCFPPDFPPGLLNAIFGGGGLGGGTFFCV